MLGKSSVWMSDLVQEFSDFIKKYELNKPAGVLQATLAGMSSEKANQFKLCAIPHQFDASILMALVPDLDHQTATSRCQEFAANASVRSYGASFVISEEIRNPLFKEWLEPDRRAEFVEANKRLVDYFSRQAGQTEGIDADTNRLNRVFHQIGADSEKGFAEFEDLFRERRQRSSPGECEILLRLVHEYDPILTSSQRASLNYQEGKIAADLLRSDEARKLFESVLVVADSSPKLRIKAIIRLGLLEHELRNWSAAITRFQEALALLETSEATIRDEFNYQIKINMGVTYREMGELQQAKQLLLESVREAHRVNTVNGMAVAYNSLGTLFRKFGEGKSAVKAYRKSLKLVEGEKQYYRIAQVNNNLGLAYLDERKLEEGERALQESLKFKAKAGDTIGLGRTYNNLMQAYRIQGKEREAVEAGGVAIKCFEEVGDYYAMALATRNLGRLYRSLGQKEEAQKSLQKALTLFERSQAVGEASSLKEEVGLLTLAQTKGMPWWTWALYVTAAVVGIFLILGLLVGFVLTIYEDLFL